MAEVPAGFPGTATGAPGNAEATTQVLAVAAKCKRVDCLLFSWTCREARFCRPLLRLTTTAPWYLAVHVG